MKIAEIFSHGGCGGRGYGSEGYGDSERYNRHRDYRGSYSEHNGEHYDRHDDGGLLGIFGEY
jgi:hypothetical protein